MLWGTDVRVRLLGCCVGCCCWVLLRLELGENLVSDVKDHDVARGENL